MAWVENLVNNMKIIIPPKLQKGDKIGIVSPSSSIQSRKKLFLKSAEKLEEALGVKAVWGKHAFGRHFYSSGTAKERLEDIHKMIADPEIRAVYFSIGGSTAIDLLDGLDYELIRNNPKIINGFSDATTIMNAVYAKTGLVVFLSVSLDKFGKYKMNYTEDWMKKAWFEGQVGKLVPNSNWRDLKNTPNEYSGWLSIKKGKTKGRIIGGSNKSFIQLLHTPYQPKLENSILVFESNKMNKRQIHRALMQLRIHGVYKKISGLLMGYCYGSDNPKVEGNERKIKNLVLEVTRGYDFPIMQIGEFGHNVENIVLPIGAKMKMDADKLELEIEGSVAG